MQVVVSSCRCSASAGSPVQMPRNNLPKEMTEVLKWFLKEEKLMETICLLEDKTQSSPLLYFKNIFLSFTIQGT